MVDATNVWDEREQIARIDRALEETHKFVAEQHKLMAEADKLRREWKFYPLVLLATGMAAGGGLVAAVATLVPRLH